MFYRLLEQAYFNFLYINKQANSSLINYKPFYLISSDQSIKHRFNFNLKSFFLTNSNKLSVEFKQSIFY